MRAVRIAAAVLLGYVAISGSLAHATGKLFYKSVLRDGTVSYSDRPLPGIGAEVLRVEPHPVDPKATQLAEVAAAKRREQLLRSFDARAARVIELDQQIPVASAAVQQARDLAERSTAVQEGDRQGRRLTPEYFRRQQASQAARLEAERQLDVLQQQRAALQP